MVAPPTRDSEENKMDEMQKLLASALATSATEKARADKAEADLATQVALAASEKARADKLDGELAGEKARADKAESARADSDAGIGARVAARVALQVAATAALGAEVKLDALTDREIKLAVIKHVDGAEIPADRSDDYVDGHYTAAVARADASANAFDSVRRAAQVAGSALDPEVAAANKMREDSLNAWKNVKESN